MPSTEKPELERRPERDSSRLPSVSPLLLTTLEFSSNSFDLLVVYLLFGIGSLRFSNIRRFLDGLLWVLAVSFLLALPFRPALVYACSLMSRGR